MIDQKTNHEVAHIAANEKVPYLVTLLRDFSDRKGVILCKDSKGEKELAAWLKEMKFNIVDIEKLAESGTCISVTSEKKYLDTTPKEIGVLVNFDVPDKADSYIERINKTELAKDHYVITFCSSGEKETLKGIEDRYNMGIKETDIYDDDFATDVCPKPTVNAKPKRERNNDRNDSKQDRNKRDNNKERRPRFRETTLTRDSFGRSFTIESSDIEEVKKAALNYFRIKDFALLNVEEGAQGKKKFVIFGPSKTEYTVKLRPIFKRLLTPYLVRILKLSDLKLYAQVSFTNNVVKVNFTGEDAKLLTENKNVLLRSLEHVSITYLKRMTSMPKGTKFLFKAFEGDHKQKSEDEIIRITEETMNKVKKSNTPVLMTAMNPAHRRIVHQHINDNEAFLSNSIGDGRFKKIEISLK